MSKAFLDINSEGRIRIKRSPGMIISKEWLEKIEEIREDIEKTYVLPQTTSTNSNRDKKV